MAAVGALIHVAIALGGPPWYAFFHAPPGLVAMARAGNPRAWISCLVIATALATCALYAFSGAGRLRPLPLLSPVLAIIASVLMLRGLVFLPLILWRSGWLAGVCDCSRIDAFLVSTSALCLMLGAAYAAGACRLRYARRQHAA